MLKVIWVCLLLFSHTVWAQQKIKIDAGNMDQATIEKLKTSGLSDDMIEQLKEQLAAGAEKSEPVTQAQMEAFFSDYLIYSSAHYHLWYPKHYNPQQEIQELDHAEQVFVNAFSKPLEKIHVVLFEDVKQVAYTAWDHFKDQSVLPFLTSEDKSQNKDMTAAKAIAHEACHFFLNNLPSDGGKNATSRMVMPKFPIGSMKPWPFHVKVKHYNQNELHTLRL